MDNNGDKVIEYAEDVLRERDALRARLAEADQVREAEDDELIEKQRLLDMAGEEIEKLKKQLVEAAPIIAAVDASVYRIGHLADGTVCLFVETPSRINMKRIQESASAWVKARAEAEHAAAQPSGDGGEAG